MTELLTALREAKGVIVHIIDQETSDPTCPVSAERIAERILKHLPALASAPREGVRDVLLNNMIVRNVLRREFGLTNGDYDELCYQIEAEAKANAAALHSPEPPKEKGAKT
jgi:hypothetical protein